MREKGRKDRSYDEKREIEGVFNGWMDVRERSVCVCVCVA